MDETDLAIFRAMGFMPFWGDPQGPDDLRPSALARRLGFGVDLVKDRIARMEETGTIRGYEIYPNLNHFGLEDVTFHTELPSEGKKQVLEQAMDLDGVVGVYDYLGGHICMQVLCRSPSDRARKERLLMGLGGLDSPPLVYMFRRPPPLKHDLSNLDWRIIKALRGQAKRPLADVADELGVTQRTVRRRMDRMIEGKDIDVVLEPDFGCVPGVIIFENIIFCAPEAVQSVRAEALHRLKGNYLKEGRVEDPALGTLVIVCFAQSQGEVEAIRARLDSVPGVDRMEVLFPASGRYNGGWLDESIADQIDATSASGEEAEAPDLGSRTA